MKVVFFSGFKEGFGGGEGTVTFEIAYAFAQKFETAMILPGDRIGKTRDKSGLLKLTIDSVGDKDISISSMSMKNVQAILDFLDEFKPDVIHVHTPMPACLIGQIWATMNKVPFVYTAHIMPGKLFDFTGYKSLSAIGKVFKMPIKQYMMDFYNKCSFVVALNKTAEREIRDFGYKGKIETIPNGRNLETYYRRRISELASKPKELAFTGYVNPRKGQRFLIEVMTYLPETFHLTLIGPANDPAYQKQLVKICKRHDLNNVTFTGRVPQSDIPVYMEKAHVFVSASTMEVQSLVIIEALASGTPVVGLSNETTDELVNDNVGKRLGRNASPQQFAWEIEKICKMRQDKYERLCQNARQSVAHLDWTNIVDRTAQIYEKYINEIKSQNINGKRFIRLEQLINFIPFDKTRDFLLSRFIPEKKQTLETQDKPNIVTDMKRLPKKTVAFAGITILGSLAIFGTWKLVQYLSNQTKKLSKKKV